MPIINVRARGDGNSSSSETPPGTAHGLETIDIHDKIQEESTKDDGSFTLRPQQTQKSEEEGIVGGRILQVRTECAHTTQVTEQAPDAFGNEEGAEIHYKTMTWWYVFFSFLSDYTNADNRLVTRNCGVCTFRLRSHISYFQTEC